MTRITSFLKHNAIAIAALFIALGGTSYAAVSLPRGSVGTPQLRRGAVTPSKLAGTAFGGRILAVTELEENGAVLKSNPKSVTTDSWTPNAGGLIGYPYKIPRDCFPSATPTQPLVAATGAIPQVAAAMDGLSKIQISENGATQMTVMIVCQH